MVASIGMFFFSSNNWGHTRMRTAYIFSANTLTGTFWLLSTKTNQLWCLIWREREKERERTMSIMHSWFVSTKQTNNIRNMHKLMSCINSWLSKSHQFVVVWLFGNVNTNDGRTFYIQDGWFGVMLNRWTLLFFNYILYYLAIRRAEDKVIGYWEYHIIWWMLEVDLTGQEILIIK